MLIKTNLWPDWNPIEMVCDVLVCRVKAKQPTSGQHWKTTPGDNLMKLMCQSKRWLLNIKHILLCLTPFCSLHNLYVAALMSSIWIYNVDGNKNWMRRCFYAGKQQHGNEVRVSVSSSGQVASTVLAWSSDIDFRCTAITLTQWQCKYAHPPPWIHPTPPLLTPTPCHCDYRRFTLA